MQKKYDAGRLKVVLDDGSKQGAALSIQNLVENYTPQTIDSVSKSLASLTEYPIREVKATVTHRFVVEPQA